jgi:hypothetical protein
MSMKTKLVSSFLALGVLAGATAGAIGPSEAGKLSKGELAAIVGIGGFVLGMGIANAGRGPEYYDYHASPWELHVERCYARYKTYNHHSDTYIGYDGFEHRCTL